MPSFLFYVCVRFASNLCEGKLEVLSLVGWFFWITTRQTRAKVGQKCWHPPKTKLQKFGDNRSFERKRIF